MFKPALASFSLLTPRERVILVSIVSARVVAHGLDILGLAAVGLIGAMVAGGLNNAADAEFLGVSVSLGSSDTYVWVAGAIAGFFVGKSVLAVVLLRLTTLFLAKVEADASADLARYLYSGDLHRVTSRSKGEIQWLVQASTEQAFSIVLFAMATVVTESTLFLAIFAMFLATDIATALILVGFFVAVIGAFQFLVSERLARLGKGTARLARSVNNDVLDITQAYREATVLEKRGWFLERLNLNRRGLARNKAIEKFALSIPRYLIESTLILGILALTAWQFAAGSEFGGLVVIGVFLAGGTRMMAALLPLQNAINQLRVTGPQAARAQDLLKLARAEPPQAHSEKSPEQPERNIAEGALSVRVYGVSFSYPDGGTHALRDINLNVQPGQFAAFVGPSGAGKTTLADVVLALLRPTEGKLTVDGIDITDKNLRAWQQTVGYVPQNIFLTDASVAENIALGLAPEDIDESRLLNAARIAQIESFIVNDLPHDYDTIVGERGVRLSGGQRQRIGIARALYHDADLIVFDEATSALDNLTEQEVMAAVEALSGDKTILIIAHRLSTVKACDRIIVMEKGRIVGFDAWAALAADNRAFQRLTKTPKPDPEFETQ